MCIDRRTVSPPIHSTVGCDPAVQVGAPVGRFFRVRMSMDPWKKGLCRVAARFRCLKRLEEPGSRDTDSGGGRVLMESFATPRLLLRSWAGGRAVVVVELELDRRPWECACDLPHEAPPSRASYSAGPLAGVRKTAGHKWRVRLKSTSVETAVGPGSRQAAIPTIREELRQCKLAWHGRIPDVQTKLPLLKPAALLHALFAMLSHITLSYPILSLPFARSCPSAFCDCSATPAPAPSTTTTHSLSTLAAASTLPVFSPCYI